MQKVATAVLLVLSLDAVCQTNGDTIVTYLNYLRTPVQAGSPNYSFIETMWPENNAWHVQLKNALENKIVCDYYYKDKIRKMKNGRYVAFYSNEVMSDSGYYANDMKSGDYYRWYDYGKIQSVYHYLNDMPVDTCTEWFEDGSIATQMVCDKQGNGTMTEYHNNGVTKGSGSVKRGEKNGSWNYFDELGRPAMQIEFDNGIPLEANCFSEKGKASTGDCIFFREAAFPGGVEGWVYFLKQNMHYPDEAMDKKIQGIVRVKFAVNVNGSLSNFRILESPGEAFSVEAIRIMKRSPRWQPAIELNRPVQRFIIQAIAFTVLKTD